MPYISSESVKAKRTALKRALPQFKFSITRENYSSIRVCIMEGPIELPANESLNPYINYREERYSSFDGTYMPARPGVANLMETIMPILNEGMGAGFEDSDYGHVPDFYTWIQIGKWDKPYVYRNPNQIAGVDFSESIEQLNKLSIFA